MKESVLITGGSGLLGLNWMMALIGRCDVTLGLHSKWIDVSDVNASVRALELESLDSLIRVLEEIGPTAVIHTVGLTNVELCELNQDLAHKVNVDLAVNVALACARLKVPLIHISTDHLFSGEMPFLDENCKPEPKNVYASTKAKAERCILEVYPESLIIRTNFYGWGPSYRQSFSDFIIKSLRKGQEVTLFEDVFYTPIMAETLVQAAHRLLEFGASGIFNIVGDERISKFQFGQQIASEFELDKSLIKTGSLVDNASLIKRPLDMSLSNKKARQYLGCKLGSVSSQLSRLRELEASYISAQCFM